MAVSKLILSELAPLVSMQHGVFYMSDPEDGNLNLVASYAFNERKRQRSARGRVYGADNLERRFGPPELSLAEHLAQRLALAVENAQLYFRAQESSNAKDQFLATVSHELRTPLNAMLGWARLLRAGKLDAAGSARASETIERNARAQAQLIEDILDISRIVMGSLEANLCSGTGAMFGDPDRIQRFIWNLLSNAIKFTPVGGRVSVHLEQTGSDLQLKVTDNGKGITAEFLSHLFERFSQADASSTRTQGGLGLGLSIVRHLVELHGGAVDATSGGPGFGATFTVSLPALPSRLEAPQKISGSIASLPARALEGVRVLAVDDQVRAREMVSVVLRGYGAEIVAVSSCNEALVSLAHNFPDLLIVDIHMPEADGCDVLARMRNVKGGATVPALALIAGSSPAETERVLHSGFQMLLPKPIKPEQLAAAVAGLSGRSTSERLAASAAGEPVKHHEFESKP